MEETNQTSALPSSHGPQTQGLFDPAALEEGMFSAANIVREFYEGLEERRVSPSMPMAEIAAQFADTLGEEGIGLDAALQDVRQKVLPHAMAVPHPRYLGLINSSPLPGGIVADSIISGFNNNAGAWQQGPPFVAAEQEALRCLAEVLGLESGTSGIVLPGGSYASLHALQLARASRLPEWHERGPRALSGDPRVYVSAASHFSAVRAAQAIGVAKRDVVRVPCIGRGVLDASALAKILREDKERGALPFALVATLGTTGTGAMDSLPELLKLCREFGLWLHVDACYGGAAAMLDDLSEHFQGIDQADSVAVDPHKWFFVPIIAGVLFTKHPKLELETFDVDASYIPTGEFVDGFRRALPTSRRAAGFGIWLSLRAHGLAILRNTVRLNLSLTRRLEERLSEQGFRVLEGGELSIACARWEPAGCTPGELDAHQTRITKSMVASGDAWFGTVLHVEQSWLRFNLVSRFTREEHVDFLAERLGSIAREG